MKVRHIDLHPDEFIAAVAGEMSPAELGVYWMICLLCYSRGGTINSDLDWLRAKFKTGKANHVVGPVLESLVASGRVFRDGNKIGVTRCQEEIEIAINRIQSASDNGRLGGRPRSGDAPQMRQGTAADASQSSLRAASDAPQIRRGAASDAPRNGSGHSPIPNESNYVKEPNCFFGEKLSRANHQPSTIKEEESPKPPSTESPSAVPSAGFEEAWKLFPRRDGKGQARRAWTAALKKADPETITAGIDKFRAQCAGKEPQFIALPATWLNGERWLDEGTKRAVGTNGNDPNSPLLKFGYDETCPTHAQWRNRVLEFTSRKFWSSRWGLPPDDPQCHCPKPIIAELMGLVR